MSLEFEGVGAGVGAVGALVWPLARVTPHVPLELAELHRHVVAVRTLVRLLVCVSVANMTHQLPARGKARLVILTNDIQVLRVLTNDKRVLPDSTCTDGALSPCACSHGSASSPGS